MSLKMIYKIRNYIFLIITLLSLNGVALADAKEAANFVNDLSQRVISIVKNTSLNDKEKEARLNSIFIESVDTRWIGKFAMGKYWRSIAAEQQKPFLDLYSNYLTALYVPNFRKYTGNIVNVIGAKKVRDKEYLVQTELTDEMKTMEIKIDFRMLQDEKELEKFIIFDIIAEGVSLITTQRAELNAVMAKEDFNALIRLLVQKTSSSRK
jgi:phospholipid transport system substrate-binding protein